MIVDGGTWTNGDTISKTSTFDASLTCSSSSELLNMVGPITMTDSNGDLVTPQTSQITNVVNGDEVLNWTIQGWNQTSGVIYTSWTGDLTATLNFSRCYSRAKLYPLCYL